MDIALASFLLGILSTTNPCLLPLYPGFLAYLSGAPASSTGKRALLGAAVLAGVLSMMVALGGLIALLAVPVGRMLAIFIPLANLVLFVLGVLLLLNKNPFQRLPQVALPVVERPMLNAYLYGLLYGPIALPCSGPLLVSIFAISFTLAEAFDKVWVFLWFGLGFGIPLFALALLSGVLQRHVTRFFAQHTGIINFLGGLLLIAVALFDIQQNWDMLQLYYS